MSIQYSHFEYKSSIHRMEKISGKFIGNSSKGHEISKQAQTTSRKRKRSNYRISTSQWNSNMSNHASRKNAISILFQSATTQKDFEQYIL